MSYLVARNMTKSYKSERGVTDVLGGIDLSVNKGEFVAVVGYSGAGKTTLMSCLAGLLMPDSGEVLLEGKPAGKPGPQRGVVFQNYSLLPWMTVSENIELGVEQVFPKMSRAERRKHVEHYVEMVNLTAARGKRPAELSGGMRQRVSVARALAMRPKVLLMDEPFSALDALTRASLQDELTMILGRDKTTVVMITNDVDEGILLADRIVPLSMGPAAVLGPEVAVDLARPRDRKAMNHSAEFKRIRKEVFEYLLGPGRRAEKGEAVTEVTAAPELTPREISRRGRALGREQILAEAAT